MGKQMNIISDIYIILYQIYSIRNLICKRILDILYSQYCYAVYCFYYVSTVIIVTYWSKKHF